MIFAISAVLIAGVNLYAMAIVLEALLENVFGHQDYVVVATK